MLANGGSFGLAQKEKEKENENEGRGSVMVSDEGDDRVESQELVRSRYGCMVYLGVNRAI